MSAAETGQIYKFKKSLIKYFLQSFNSFPHIMEQFESLETPNNNLFNVSNTITLICCIVFASFSVFT